LRLDRTLPTFKDGAKPQHHLNEGQYRMAEDRLDIDMKTLEDDIDQQQVEFEGEVEDERYLFAVQYSVLEAISATIPDGDALAIFKAHTDEIADAALVALGRDPDSDTIVISEDDLE
jgi:hypothetical protein